jgi:putative SOS response-associated peptidase YedK
MCGRYTIITKIKVIEKRFQVDATEVKEIFTENVNVAPGDKAPVVTSADPHKLQLLTFGMSPSWAKKRMYLINARSEGDHNKENDPNFKGSKGIIRKPSFRKPIRSQRCLVIADAFIEGPQKERLSKPYLIYSKDKKRPFAFAGIWDEWIDQKTGEVHQGFAIITTTPNALLQKVGHHRSPVIIAPEDEHSWLNLQTPLHEVTSLLKPFPPEDFNAYPISPEIKKARNKDPYLLQPIGERLITEYDYILFQELDLQGMGESQAKRRREAEDQDDNPQLNLF